LKRLAQLSNKYVTLLLGFLKPLGFWGMGAVAVLDSSSIPVPMDLIMAGYAWSDAHRFYLYVLAAAVGSAIGGLVPYWIGRAGGEIFLMKRIDRARFEKMRDRFEKQEFLALMIPSIMPPPTPWKLFVFAAGVFEMRVITFMLAVAAGRTLRFTVVSLLAIKYGPQIVHQLTALMQQHLIATLVAMGVVLVVLAFLAIQKVKGRRGVAK
jgi:membrane protein YqaA with SNARE-associated domain